MKVQIKHADKKIIANALAELAAAAPEGPYRFFRRLVHQTHLSDSMKRDLANIGQASPDIDAWDLMEYAAARDVNPEDRSYTTLGSVLQTIIESESYGWETRRALAVITAVYRLYKDEAVLTDLMERFQIPLPAQGTITPGGGAPPSLPLTGAGGPSAVGPDIQWRGANPDLVLQSWPWSEPDYLDVGFLMLATERAAAVCHVELPSRKRTGTGFLIAPDLLLTNYHVLKFFPDEEINANAADVTLRFGFVTGSTGQTFKLASDPILAFSQTHELDYVLLRADSAVKNAEGIKPLSVIASAPGQDKSLNIIQHPEGQTLKIALSSNGLSGIYEDSGLIQYLSRTAGGSSGSPCFNDKWELVALHHAERSRIPFGSIREGILFSRIHAQIKNHLPA